MPNDANLLVVEDSPSDAKLLLRVLKETSFTKAVHLVRNGQEALDFVYRRAPYEDAPRPDLILLDLNLPRLNGFEVLHQLKGDDALRVIPVVVMTTSEDQDDVLNSYRGYANSYIVKPHSVSALETTLNTLEQFWFTVVRLPD